MQNRYAGDLGDFLKLALLRWLVASNTAERTLRLGVVWYLVPDEDHNADGKHINYLDPTRPAARRFRTLDPDLYDALTSMMRSEASRSVAGLERCGALPPETVTFGTPLTFGSLAVTDRAQRLERRQRWLDAALTATADCDAVFVDPDNGVRRNDHATQRHRNKAEKHAYLDEIHAFLARDQTVVAYHHADRSAPVEEQAHRRMADVAAQCGIEPLAAVRASAGTVRLFLIVPAPRHEHRVRKQLAALGDSQWATELHVYWHRPGG